MSMNISSGKNPINNLKGWHTSQKEKAHKASQAPSFESAKAAFEEDIAYLQSRDRYGSQVGPKSEGTSSKQAFTNVGTLLGESLDMDERPGEVDLGRAGHLKSQEGGFVARRTTNASGLWGGGRDSQYVIDAKSQTVTVITETGPTQVPSAMMMRPHDVPGSRSSYTIDLQNNTVEDFERGWTTPKSFDAPMSGPLAVMPQMDLSPALRSETLAKSSSLKDWMY